MPRWRITSLRLGDRLSVALLVGAFALAPLSTSSLLAQFVAFPVVVEGTQPAGLTSPISGVGRPSANAAGVVAFEGDDVDPTLDDFIWVGNGVLITAGTPLVGAPGTLSEVHPFESTRAIDALGRVGWSGTLAGVPFGSDEFLARDATVLLREGDPAPIAGRLFEEFSFVSIDDAGRVYCEAQMSGPRSDDEVLIVHDASGTSLLAMNATTAFHEGATISGGPLDGHRWDNGAFLDLRVNGLGTALLEGDLETTGGGLATSLDNEVLVRKRPGLDYELLLREGTTQLATPLAGLVPFGAIHELDLADDDDWVVRGTVSTPLAGPEFDEVVVASLAGGPAGVIAQEGTDLSAVLGIPGATLGAIQGVRINTQEEVLLLANVTGASGALPFDEALFLISGGTWSVVATDETTTIASLGDAPVVDLITDHLVLTDSTEIFIEARVQVAGILRQSILAFALPAVFPVENLECTQDGAAPTATATWDNPSATPYDGIRVFVDGALAAVLPGSATQFQTATVIDLDRAVPIALEPFTATDVGADRSCAPFILSPPDVLDCAAPFVAIDDVGTTVTTMSVASNATIGDLRVSVDLVHDAIEDCTLTLVSPGGVAIELLSGLAALTSNLTTTFADFGTPGASSDLSVGTVIAPGGPARLRDLRCTPAGGIWSLVVEDSSVGTFGTIFEWCLAISEEPAPSLNCCPLPTDVRARSGGPCAAGVLLSWTPNATYDALEWVRDAGTNAAITLTPLPNATTLLDPTAISGDTYTYTLQVRCAPGGTMNVVDNTTVTVDPQTPPAITGLVAATDPCGSTVSLAWDDLGVPYDALTITRNGAFLADVTAQTSFVDAAPLLGGSQYAVVASCGSASIATALSVDLDLAAPVVECVSDPALCDATVTLFWTNPRDYDAIELWIDGNPSGGLLPSDATTSGPHTITVGPLSVGPHDFDWQVSCGPATASSACSSAALAATNGETDLILALEGRESGGDRGAIDSATALSDALAAIGVGALISAPVDGGSLADALPCAIDPTVFTRIWVCAGTFPHDARLTAPEREILAEWNRDFSIGLYLESGDHWAFQPAASSLDLRDGIEVAIAASGTIDGDDTLTSLAATVGGSGFNPSVFFPAPVPYAQDNLASSDRNDRFSLSGTTLGIAADPEVASRAALWRNAPDGLPDPADPDEALATITGVLAFPTVGAPMISQSFEFGGFARDPLDPTASASSRAQLAAFYVNALGGAVTTGTQWVRGDTNQDGGVNIADAIHLLAHLFPGPAAPPPVLCREGADANDDGVLNISDPVTLLLSLFGIPPVPLPLPNEQTGCGTDATPSLGCTAYPHCP